MSTYKITRQVRDHWKKHRQGIYATPRAWVLKGMNLVYAFEAVAAASNNESWHLFMDDQAFMLAGMAVEVHLKSILVNEPTVRAVVTSDVAVSDADNKLRKTFYSHDLGALSEAGKVLFTDSEKKIAAALSQYINWRGRYVMPTEKSLDNLIPVILPDGLVGQAHRVLIDDARALIKCVIDEVNARLFAGGMEQNTSSNTNNPIRYPAYPPTGRLNNPSKS